MTSSTPAGAAQLLGGIDAVELRGRLLASELSCVEVATAFLAAVGGDALRVWAAVDPDLVLATAASLDQLVPPTREALPLFGVPIAIKDNFDTEDLLTEYGSRIYAGARPDADAAAVARLRAAGALIAGKAKCAEFAWMTPPDTLNPLDRSRTPGGSSSGSAAGVAAGTIPLATGTQTAGSINRPASYCGVLGYKPTFGAFPSEGVKPLAGSLDTVGLFARSVRDLALVAGVLQDGWPAPGALGDAPPRLGFARTPLWSHVSAETRAAIESWLVSAHSVGIAIEDVSLPGGFEALVQAQTTIQMRESAVSLDPELTSSPELLSEALHSALREGAAIPPERYAAATEAAAELGLPLGRALERFDGVLTPSADGVPPVGLEFTGDPLFCRVWTLIGAPCVSLPLVWTDAGLPAGLQLVGAPGADGPLLRAAEWLMERLVRPWDQAGDRNLWPCGHVTPRRLGIPWRDALVDQPGVDTRGDAVRPQGRAGRGLPRNLGEPLDARRAGRGACDVLPGLGTLPQREY